MFRNIDIVFEVRLKSAKLSIDAQIHKTRYIVRKNTADRKII